LAADREVQEVSMSSPQEEGKRALKK
jgi:hypothetical protein